MQEARATIREQFSRHEDRIIRTVSAGRLSGRSIIQDIKNHEDPQLAWDRLVLSGVVPEYESLSDAPNITIADVFCGAGGLSAGTVEACRALGLRTNVAFGGDQDQEALAVFESNLRPSTVTSRNISTLVDYAIDGQADTAQFSYPPCLLEESLLAWQNKVTVLVGGPPCQGHSNLNNKTRGEDPRNLLYLSVPALAVALNVSAVIIENVPEVRQDKQSVFSTASSLLRSEGFHVASILMNATSLGVPQTRKRVFLIASKGGELPLDQAYEACSRPLRSIMHAISDLEDEGDDASIFRSTSRFDAVSQSRIDYLFDNELYELPNELRPDCHKDGHSYPSVYGRLRADLPSGTITQGFNTIGRGRFIHPTRRRTITPHEAARIQGFPDQYDWNQPSGSSWARSTYAKLIGNAVPPMMGYSAMLAILASLYPNQETLDP